jgi:chromosome segregation ATPase
VALSGYERLKRHRAKRKVEHDALKEENDSLRERCRKLLAANLRLKRQLIEADDERERLSNEVEDLNELFMNEVEEAEGLRHMILAARGALYGDDLPAGLLRT